MPSPERFRLKVLLHLLLLVFVIVPLLAWWLVKPVRVLAPRMVPGVHCVDDSFCIDDLARLDAARVLYHDAKAYVGHRVTPLDGPSRMVFCSTEACADAFGLGARSAVTLGTFGTVIGPRGWKPYYLRHELIHVLQAQQLGTLRLLFKPAWFVEGMAYALSDDPRAPLAEPFESQRRAFRAWYAGIGPQGLWVAAGML